MYQMMYRSCPQIRGQNVPGASSSNVERHVDGTGTDPARKTSASDVREEN